MARPKSNKSSYFSMDVDYFSNRKIRKLQKQCGLSGVMTHIIILCSIYSDQAGYCTVFDDNLSFDIAERLNITEENLISIVKAALEIGLFDKAMFDNHRILTSRAVQLRFQEMVRAKASKNPVTVNGHYWLLSDSETASYITISTDNNSQEYVYSESYSGNNGGFSENNEGFSENNGGFSGKNSTNKRKEKEKENKLNKKKEDSAPEGALPSAAVSCTKISVDSITAQYERYIGRASPAVRDGIVKFLKRGMEPQLLVRLIQYACEQGKPSWQYIKAAADGNLRDKIKTLKDYEEQQRLRSTGYGKRFAFNNYTDTNKPDYSDFGAKLTEELLREAEQKEEFLNDQT